MKSVNVLIKPASSSCNLACRYCFYTDVSDNRETYTNGIMDYETVDILINRIAEAICEKGVANIAFQGGEPTCAGLSYFEYFVSKCCEHANITFHFSIQTNATLIDEKWAFFFEKHHFLVGISLDGYQSNMDLFRYDPMKKGIYYKVMKAIDLLKKHHVETNILTVVTGALARHPKALFDFYLSHHFKYVQLIPCLPNLDETENEMSLTPDLFSYFYISIFREWNKARVKGKYISINLFDNLAGILHDHVPYQCGYMGHCDINAIIESNGDIYPCDFYCLDEYKMGNIKDMPLSEFPETGKAKDFLRASDCMKEPCHHCPFTGICYGACRRQNVCFLTDTRCAYREVLYEIIPYLQNIVDQYDQAVQSGCM